MKTDNDFELTTLDLSKDAVRFHSQLSKAVSISPRLKTILDLDTDVLSCLFPPIFLLKQNTYYLVGRYWTYSLHMAARSTKIVAVIIYDEKSIRKIQKYDALDKQMLLKIEAQKETDAPSTNKTLRKSKSVRQFKSRKSISIEKSLALRRICPFSHPDKEHALSTPRKKLPPDSEGLMHLRCVNRSKGCDFDGAVTPFELSLLKVRDYPTYQWLIEKSDSVCPKCEKNPLYKRTLRWDDKTVTTYEVCRNYFSINNRCDYIRQIIG